MINKKEAYRCINHCTLFLLQLDDPTFDAVFDDEFDGLDRTVLAQTMDPIHSLVLYSRVPSSLNQSHEQLTAAKKREIETDIPPAIHEIHPRCFSQVQRDSSSLQ